jgi:hypothetical protein
LLHDCNQKISCSIIPLLFIIPLSVGCGFETHQGLDKKYVHYGRFGKKIAENLLNNCYH